jgi:stage II sporulation protein AA (anti-sigma F factor antagonist)
MPEVFEGADDGRRVVHVVGDVDLDSSSQLERFLADRGPGDLVVDLSGVTFIDSAGIAVLVKAHMEAEQRGERLALANPSRSTQRILELTGLTEVFEVTTVVPVVSDDDSATG